MQLSYSTKLPLTVQFSQNSMSKKSGAVSFQLTVTAYPSNAGETIPQGNIDEVVWQVVNIFDKTTYTSIDDPFLPQYLEPKNGFTKQEFIKSLRADLEKSVYGLVVVGREVPPNTFDRRVLIVQFGPLTTIEALGSNIMKQLQVLWAQNGLPVASLKLEMANADNNTTITLSDYTTTSQLALSL